METKQHSTAPSHPTVGERLREARLERGLDLQSVAQTTRVPLRHLAAIETDDHDRLPALPYTLGFVKAFARAVGLDPAQIGAQFRAETDTRPAMPQYPPPEPIASERLPSRRLVIGSVAALLAVIAIVVLFGFNWLRGSSDTPVASGPAAAPTADGADASLPAMREAAHSVEEGEPIQPGSETAMASAADPAPATAAAAPGAPPAAALPAAAAAGPVVITASEDAWLKISDRTTGETVKIGILAAGERFQVPDRPNLVLWTGRAGVLELSVGGRKLPPLGGPAETVRNLSLAPADLLARASAAREG